MIIYQIEVKILPFYFVQEQAKELVNLIRQSLNSTANLYSYILCKNLYQIIWTSDTAKSLDRLNSDRNFLLDNLSTILPDHFFLDQIVGEVNVFPVSLSVNIPIFNSRNLILVGDSFHTFHPVGGQGLNTCWRDVNAIFDIFKRTRFSKNLNLQILKYKYYSTRFLDVSATIIVTDLLITFFANRNLFLLPFRKFSFFILRQ